MQLHKSHIIGPSETNVKQAKTKENRPPGSSWVLLAPWLLLASKEKKKLSYRNLFFLVVDQNGTKRTGANQAGGPWRTQEDPGGARRTLEEPGKARRTLEEPGRARRSQEEPGGARRNQEEPGGARRSLVPMLDS